MQNKSTNVASVGYEVRPSENGGFVVFRGDKEASPYRSYGFYAFSNSADLLAFLQQQHGALTE
ncbi:hypothetical protein [Brucella intermedia]|uniref:hypothetical protein n=1 Tax=Brucella intermedia TaxID=94625 RepID=UPI00235DF439|nr:hypothetical protein [Brucella intermedia]